MLDSKLFVTLVGLFVTVFAVCNNNKKNSITENFWGNPGRRTKVFREVRAPNGQVSNLQNNWQSMLTNDKFISTPSFQGTLSPRFANTDFGANIRYNVPDNKYMAAPCNPLTFGEMATEGYKQTKENFGCAAGKCGGGCGAVSCGPNSQISASAAAAGSDVCNGGNPPSGFAAGNFNNVMGDVWNGKSGGVIVNPSAQSTIPVADMTAINAQGDVTQPIIYDRFIFANQNSRLRSQGDPIRGDLAIVPCNNGWFNPSVNPNIDLQEGALNVMGGSDNGTARALGNLIYATSGGADTAIGGMNMAGQFGPQGAMSLNMSNQFTSSLSAGNRDVQVSSFP